MFFKVKKYFKCESTPSEVLKTLPYSLVNDNRVNARIINIAPDGITFQIELRNFWVRNSFAPRVHINLEENKIGSTGCIEYSLSKSTGVLLLLYLTFCFSLECLLLILAEQLASPYFLALPIVLMFFATSLSALGLYGSAHSIHRHLLMMIMGPKTGDGLREPY